MKNLVLKAFSVLFLARLTIAVSAQHIKVPRDTSFSVYTTYQKERKKYPFIQIAKSVFPAGVFIKSNIVYRTLGRRKLTLDIVYSTKKENRYPAVLLVHGGGWRSGDKSQCAPIALQLAERGYISIPVEYRLTLEAKYPAAVYDLKAAIRWVRANAALYNIDTDKIAVMGFSSGGQLAALLGTTNRYEKLEGKGDHKKQSSEVQAVIDVDGILAFKHPESQEGTTAAAWLGGTYEKKSKTWQEASALTHVSENAASILFINSSLPRFHAGRDDMIKKLNTFKIYSEVHELPEAPHPFWLFHPWFDPTVNFTVAFLDKVFQIKH